MRQASSERFVIADIFNLVGVVYERGDIDAVTFTAHPLNI